MSSPSLRLYHFATSNSSWRIRWAIALKAIPCEFVTVDLATGEQHSAAHLARNPLGLVPVLEIIGDPDPFLGETVAILDWLDRQFPSPALFPEGDQERVKAHQLAQIINADTHPLQNRSTGAKHSSDPAERLAWTQYWIGRGLAAYETIVAPHAQTFSLGDVLTYPDLFLVPMCRNALNNQLDLAQFPVIQGIYQRALATPSAQASAPERYLAAARSNRYESRGLSREGRHSDRGGSGPQNP